MNERSQKGWNRAQIAERLARDVPEGWYVNLGIGIPTLVANYVREDREVIFQSENGILGFGRLAQQQEVSPWLQNAGKQPVVLRPGGCYFHHADSFGQIRGGHLDLCVLGAYQVSPRGDLANWATSENDLAHSVGGAMDLAAGTKRIWVTMEHVTRDGRPRLVRRCSYPLTAAGVVQRVYTNLGVLSVTPTVFEVVELAPHVTLDDVVSSTDAPVEMTTGNGALPKGA